MRPDLSASSTIATPMRSFTLESGLKNSSFSNTSATAPCFLATRLSRTSGVLPMVSVMLSKMRANDFDFVVSEVEWRLQVGCVSQEFSVLRENGTQRQDECPFPQISRHL